MKCCGPTQEHEPRLTALLHREFPGLVAEVLALHSTRPWMLVAEGGKKLGEMYSGDELLRKWREILPRCALMQRDVTPLTNEIIAFGTPDRRAARLLAGFADVVAGEPEVSGRRPDRLTADERRALTSVHARLAAGLNALAALGIDDTLNHNDLHQNNVLVQRGRMVIFDWGDARCASRRSRPGARRIPPRSPRFATPISSHGAIALRRGSCEMPRGSGAASVRSHER